MKENRKIVKAKGVKNKNAPTLHKKWQDSDFTVEAELGQGRFGKVYKAIEKSSKKVIALKEISAECIKETNSFDLIKNEIEIHTRLIHPNITRMYGFFPGTEKLTMVMEYMDGGDIFSKLQKEGGSLSEPDAANILDQLVDALTYLRDRHIIHRDIKPENILLSKIKGGTKEIIKLTDFTWAAHCINERRVTVCGTWGYCAPEVATAIDYDANVDVWSAGVLLYHMLTGELLVKGDSLRAIQNTMINFRISFPDKPVISNEAKNLLTKMLSRLPEDRPSLEKIKIDSWLLINVSKYKAEHEKNLKS